ncbi:hypothetical protein J6590_018937 [Homalodisca vitripennis]|nr:hypothetical protein J6590_018937 [Homalodisca vitripennis]
MVKPAKIITRIGSLYYPKATICGRVFISIYHYDDQYLFSASQNEAVLARRRPLLKDNGHVSSGSRITVECHPRRRRKRERERESALPRKIPSLRPCHTAVASRPSIHSMNVRVCRDGLESRQTTRHASASAANATGKSARCLVEGVGEVLYAHARAFVASPTSAKDRSSRIAQQTVADATNVAPRRLCQCDLSYLTT